jgi:hypothetical protein
MLHTQKIFNDNGVMVIDGKIVRWRYHHPVDIVIHEKTETFSCDLIGKDRMCLHDLKVKLRAKFRGAATAKARREFVDALDAEQKRKDLIDAQPVKVFSEDFAS